MAPLGLDQSQALAVINAVSARDKQRRQYTSTD